MAVFKIGEAPEDQLPPAPPRMLSPMELKTDRNIARTSAGLREVLFKELEDIRAGRSDLHRARAVASLASQIIASVRMEIEFAGKMQRNDSEAKMPTPLNLVRE
jgi:hypothetical protein